MAQLRVDSDQITAAVGQTQASIERVRTENAGLTANLTNLQNSWTGDASISFQDVLLQWRSLATQVEEQIGRINHALGIAGTTYGSTETDVRRMFLAG